MKTDGICFWVEKDDEYLILFCRLFDERGLFVNTTLSNNPYNDLDDYEEFIWNPDRVI